MPKKIFSAILIILIFSITLISPLSVSAYEPTGVEINAKAGILVSLDTGEFIYENNIDQKVYPASIAKIMTAVLMLESERYDPEGKIAMTKEILDMVLGTGLAVSLLKAGDEFTQLDLLYMVLMSSFGDSTYLAAQYYGDSIDNFVAMMNSKAAELGLSGTHYSNPVGLHDEETYTTVRDTYTLATYALKNETFKQICETPRYSITTSISGKRTLSTTNFLQDNTTKYYYPYAKGVKTGFTEAAGRCLVSTASYKGYSYMCILMGCPDNKSNRQEFLGSADLYRWAFKNFSFKEIATSNEPVCEMPVENSLKTDFVSLYFKEPFISVLPNSANDSTIVIKPHLNGESAKAPIKKGDVLGTAEVIYAEKTIGEVELISAEDIEVSRLLVITNYIKSFFTSIYMKLIILLAVLAVLIFIISCILMNLPRLKKRRARYIPYKEKQKHRHNK